MLKNEEKVNNNNSTHTHTHTHNYTQLHTTTLGYLIFKFQKIKDKEKLLKVVRGKKCLTSNNYLQLLRKHASKKKVE